MVDCPDCDGLGYVLRKVPERVWNGELYQINRVLVRLVCSTCTGKGQVSLRVADKIREFAKERAKADKAEEKAVLEKMMAEVPTE
jgi:hypothetical protein